MNTDEDKELLKKLAEDEPLRVAWAEWEHTTQVSCGELQSRLEC